MPESVTEFAARARTWLAENMTRIDPDNPLFFVRAEQSSWDRATEMQRKLHAGGFAGICFPANTAAWGWTDRVPAGLRRRMPHLRNAADPQRPELHHLRGNHPSTWAANSRSATASRPPSAARRSLPAVQRAQRRLGPGRRHHPRRPPGRQVDHQRRQDLEHQRLRRRLWPDAGPH